ncbi:MAG: DUF305 domain-containing protein [Herminiimonas sp.]|nr:DUF305 domain-containing protein [Herminiimonas sp.]
MKSPAFKSAYLLWTHRSRLLVVSISCSLSAAWLPAAAQDIHQHQHPVPTQKSPAPFVASTAKPFSALMNDAMAVMDDGMRRAPMSGVAEHDFVTMMIPHHQGAIDMAKALLLYNKDPELQNLAQGILTEQQNEIKLMQAWLKRYQALQPRVPVPPK